MVDDVRAWARQALFWAFLFSFVVNLLALTASVYMLQVYDRVLVSHSHATLVSLTVLAVAALMVMAALDIVRSRLLVRLGDGLSARAAPEMFGRLISERGAAPYLKDLDTVRGFLGSPTMTALLDAPWMPLYVALVYVLHPWLGHVALAGAIVLAILGVVNERVTERPLSDAGNALAASNRLVQIAVQNADSVTAMGMQDAMVRHWQQRHDRGVAMQALATDRSATLVALTKAYRLALQVAILGVGAALVIRAEITAGAMIAASIIMGRAIAPVENAIGGWRAFIQVRQSLTRLLVALRDIGRVAAKMPLPAPTGRLTFESASAQPPGVERVTLGPMNLKLEPGEALAVGGPSGSGKSTFGRMAAGIWAPANGSVRLDGSPLAAWPRHEIGPYVGYLPQDVQLFEGTVAQNIARMEPVDPERVVEAARLCGAHSMILTLPQGYDTTVAAGGTNLSGGQRQWIGLARAVFRLPALVVLDEPTSQLDAEGESAVRALIAELKKFRRTVVVISHRPSVLAGTDAMLILMAGQMARFGPTAEVMSSVMRAPASTAPTAGPSSGDADG